jgi:beta-lactamase class A
MAAMLWARGVVLALVAEAASAPLGPPPPAVDTPAAPKVEVALTRLLTAPHADPAWFTPAFLVKVPAARLDTLLAPLREAMGPLRIVMVDGRDYRADFARGSIPIVARLDGQGRFSMLLLKPPELLPTSLDEAVRRFSSLPGKVGLLAIVDGQPRAALAPDTPLAVGSAFKLAVLAALRARIAARQLDWTTVVALDDHWRSLPSGVLQTWPTGSHLTIETLASAMISISDNTAADALAALVGREAIDAKAPARLRPFLTTREAFVLKAPENAALLVRYRAATLARRRELLREVAARPLPRALELSRPTALDIEWYFSPRELCALMGEVAELPLMTINPGIGAPAPGERIAFKGGSEPGVLNLTLDLVRGGHHACVAATWNDPSHDVDTPKLMMAVRGLVASLLPP